VGHFDVLKIEAKSQIYTLFKSMEIETTLFADGELAYRMNAPFVVLLKSESHPCPQ